MVWTARLRGGDPSTGSIHQKLKLFFINCQMHQKPKVLFSIWRMECKSAIIWAAWSQCTECREVVSSGVQMASVGIRDPFTKRDCNLGVSGLNPESQVYHISRKKQPENDGFSSLESRGRFLNSMSVFGFVYLTLGSCIGCSCVWPTWTSSLFFCCWFLWRIVDSTMGWKSPWNVRTTVPLRESMSWRNRFSKHQMTSKSSKFPRWLPVFPWRYIPWNLMVWRWMECSFKNWNPWFFWGDVLIIWGGKFCGHLP